MCLQTKDRCGERGSYHPVGVLHLVGLEVGEQRGQAPQGTVSAASDSERETRVPATGVEVKAGPFSRQGVEILLPVGDT